MIVEPAPAKINLALHVRHRRLDGYHGLETLFAFATDGDVVTVEQAAEDGFAIHGPFAAALRADADNLVTRARDAFRAEYGAPAVAITLTKNLPIASGIGGGSADAAATLRALAWLLQQPSSLEGGSVEPETPSPATDPRLLAIAARLGADVPACLTGRTTVGTGRGDDLHEVTGLPGAPLLLVNPGVAVSTAAVFAAWDGVDRGPLPSGDLLARARAGRNDLEPPAVAIAPVIAQVRALLDVAPGAFLSRMSGSGATCFALFDHLASRDRAAKAAAARGWWTLSTTLA